MEERSYRVILEGTIREGVARKDVVRKLSVVFKKDEVFVERLLSGCSRPIRTGVDAETASKYQSIIRKIGAIVRVEPDPVTEELAPAGDDPRPAEASEKEEPVVCPRCGYTPSKADDVILVRGDCPRCGLIVRRTGASTVRETAEDLDDEGMPEDYPNLYGAGKPASWHRRGLAACYTFGVFLLVYFGVVLLFILVFFPPASVPLLVGRDFLSVALANFPLLLSAVSIFLVTFVFPLFREGSTPGQKAFSIRMLFLGEGTLSGLLLALALRSLAVGAVSYAPGLVFLRLWGLVFDEPPESHYFVVALLAALAWAGIAMYSARSTDGRGVLDIIAGAIQTEEGILPPKPWLRAILPVGIACAFLLLVGFLLPLALRP
ncbi:MAG: RDD family protein [Thermodesulfobacteriota bacterium]